MGVDGQPEVAVADVGKVVGVVLPDGRVAEMTVQLGQVGRVFLQLVVDANGHSV